MSDPSSPASAVSPESPEPRLRELIAKWREGVRGVRAELLTIRKDHQEGPRYGMAAVEQCADELEKVVREGVALVSPREPDEVQVVGRAMWAALDVVKAHIGGFENWPDALKLAFSDAIIDRSPLTDAEIAHGQALAKQFGWEMEKGDDMNDRCKTRTDVFGRCVLREGHGLSRHQNAMGDVFNGTSEPTDSLTLPAGVRYSPEPFDPQVESKVAAEYPNQAGADLAGEGLSHRSPSTHSAGVLVSPHPQAEKKVLPRPSLPEALYILRDEGYLGLSVADALLVIYRKQAAGVPAPPPSQEKVNDDE